MYSWPRGQMFESISSQILLKVIDLTRDNSFEIYTWRDQRSFILKPKTKIPLLIHIRKSRKPKLHSVLTNINSLNFKWQIHQSIIEKCTWEWPITILFGFLIEWFYTSSLLPILLKCVLPLHLFQHGVVSAGKWKENKCNKFE